MPRAILDTNVLVSALISADGAPRLVVDRALTGGYTLVTADTLLSELARALRYGRVRQRYGLTEGIIDEFVDIVRTAGERIDDPVDVPRVVSDAADNVVLACCRDGRADLLVTGDRLLLELGTFEGTRICSPRTVLDLPAE